MLSFLKRAKQILYKGFVPHGRTFGASRHAVVPTDVGVHGVILLPGDCDARVLRLRSVAMGLHQHKASQVSGHQLHDAVGFHVLYTVSNIRTLDDVASLVLQTRLCLPLQTLDRVVWSLVCHQLLHGA